MEDHCADNQDFGNADENRIDGIPTAPATTWGGWPAMAGDRWSSASIISPNMNSVLYFSVRLLALKPIAEPIEGYRRINKSYGRVWLTKKRCNMPSTIAAN
ncbi:hypothetical protein SAMN04488557_1028 [Hyphomicrobium facile]|uniref:Uncharacterized protein n=1 Tax=Hyphomicrobium facile TaxID=51670 RepID=A0A1I7N1J8_9HYPH|nr:hypothetical protein SAMN04488557_1028 [Hyphomicrobium facile]